MVAQYAETGSWETLLKGRGRFSCRDYCEPKAPCDFMLISKIREPIGDAGGEELLAKTITVAVEILALFDYLKRILARFESKPINQHSILA